ncbi:MAG TPA: zinc-binding dehydrogenase [Myxococcota bacterium]|nr:zinc-binding dehydrogenase [Myxococcota bacterium]
MKQVRVHGPDDVRIDEIDPPEPGPRDAVVRVAACGICGTDLSYIRRGGLAGPSGTPMSLGHELAGVVEWVGADVPGTAVGARVVVKPGNDELGRIGNGAREGGLTPSLLVREAARGGLLYRVPEALSLEVAALAEPLAVGMQSVERAQAARGDKVAVFGCGPIGLFAIATLRDRGIEDVVAIEPTARRRDLALELGARAALDPAEVDVWRELARIHGTTPFAFGPTPATNAFIEASGAAKVITDVIQRARVGARLSVVAVHYQPIPTNYTLVMMKQLSIHGSMEYPPRFEDALDLLERRDLSPVITHRVPLERFDDALALLRGSKECGKVLVTMGADR